MEMNASWPVLETCQVPRAEPLDKIETVESQALI